MKTGFQFLQTIQSCSTLGSNLGNKTTSITKRGCEAYGKTQLECFIRRNASDIIHTMCENEISTMLVVLALKLYLLFRNTSKDSRCGISLSDTAEHIYENSTRCNFERNGKIHLSVTPVQYEYLQLLLYHVNRNILSR